MISKKLQYDCEFKYNLEKSTTNIIFLEGYYRENDFLDTFPQFVKISQGNYRDMVNGLEWKLVKASAESCRGRRIKRAIIDTRISEELFREGILPACAAGRCIRMEFFD